VPSEFKKLAFYSVEGVTYRYPTDEGPFELVFVKEFPILPPNEAPKSVFSQMLFSGRKGVDGELLHRSESKSHLALEMDMSYVEVGDFLFDYFRIPEALLIMFGGQLECVVNFTNSLDLFMMKRTNKASDSIFTRLLKTVKNEATTYEGSLLVEDFMKHYEVRT
jgi:hypothetical protein